jgi:lysozyme
VHRALGLSAVGLLLAVTGCSPDDGNRTESQSPPSSPTSSPTSPTSSAPTLSSNASVPPAPQKVRVRHRGIDASHHQGAIDWQAVADDGVSFAYLKATEGTTYTDPTFAAHRAEAQDLGIDVGGYHYFQLCSSGADQARHFASVLGKLGAGDLPPAIDLELAGSCPTPPPRGVLLAEVRTFLRQVEAATEREPVVYLYPELEEEYDFAGALGDYRQWVRSLDGRPDRDWWIWQQTDSGSVDGIAGPVDTNVMWSHEVSPR